jgi:hypothetical protein
LAKRKKQSKKAALVPGFLGSWTFSIYINNIAYDIIYFAPFISREERTAPVVIVSHTTSSPSIVALIIVPWDSHGIDRSFIP